MIIGEQYKELVEKKYNEAREAKIDTIILDQEMLGGLTLFLKDKPAMCMGSFIMDDSTEVFVGADSIEAVS